MTNENFDFESFTTRINQFKIFFFNIILCVYTQKIRTKMLLFEYLWNIIESKIILFVRRIVQNTYRFLYKILFDLVQSL